MTQTSGKPKRPILRYHGGKWMLASWIIAHFPQHRIYVEPFCGSASVLMQKPRVYSEVLNDQWDTVVNVFTVLRSRDKAKELERRLRLTPFSRTDYDRTFKAKPKRLGDVEAARLSILRSFAGFGSASTNGEYATGFRSNANKQGTVPAHDWANYPTHIGSFVERLQGVVIDNKPAIEVIKQQDTKETLFYVDPPYPHETRNMDRGNASYAFELTDDDHRSLAMLLRSVKGMVVISGYPCDLYDKELYPDWQRFERQHLADGARKRTEVLWISPNTQINGRLF